MSTEQETTTSAAPVVEKPQPSSPDKPAKPVAAAKTRGKTSSGKGSGVLAGLALLLSMAALGGSGYLWYLQQNAPQQQEPAPVEDLRPELEKLSARLAAQVDTLQSDLGAARQQLQTIKQETDTELEQLSRDGVAMLSQVTDLGRTDRDDWQLAEVEYLLRLAHQRVVMGGELKSAASLLSNADNILHDLNMAGLHQVRKQVARDLAAVRAAVELDSEGIYLTLEALQQQSGTLPFFGMPEIDAPAEEPVAAVTTEADDWKSTLERSWHQAVAKFKTLVVVQKRDGPVEPLLSEAWQLLVRERLALDLEQAKNAVVLQQQTIFREALGNASELVQSHYLPDHPATQSVLTELEALQQQKIVMDLPDISGSQEAVRAYIDQKYQGQEQLAPLAEEPSPAEPEQADDSTEQADSSPEQQQAAPTMEQEEAP